MTKIMLQKTSGKAGSRCPAFPEDEAGLPWLSLLLDAYAVIDKGIAIAISREKRKQNKRLACAEKCDICCRANTDIPVYPLELAGITWYATEKVKRPLRDIMRQQLLSQAAHPPCPFLIENICAVYPVRPIACRQYIVFGKPCADNEDPFYSRREDLLTPIQDFTNQAIFIMLPFYGIFKEADRQKAVQNRFIHTKVQNIFSCNWKSLAEKMSTFDAAKPIAK
jgi:Fe-S-cluster containining protein